MNKIRLVAFDLDGTIGDTIPLCIRAFKEAVTPYVGHELSDSGLDCLSAAWGVSEVAAQDLARHNKNVFCSIQSLCNYLLPE